MSRRLVLVALAVPLLLAACGHQQAPRMQLAAARTAHVVSDVDELRASAHARSVAAKQSQLPLSAPQDARGATQAPSQHSAPATTPAKRSGALSAGPDDAFWRRLSQCESPNGDSGTFAGYFQFSSDTAAKVGYHAGESYDEQLAQAKTWLAMIRGDGGSKSGWPRCWWVALRG